MTPDDARAREREAREAVWATMRAYAEFGNQWTNEEDAEELDAYAAAVRAATLAAVRERVEGLLSSGDDPNHDGGEHRCHYCVEGDTLLRVIAALDALAGEGS